MTRDPPPDWPITPHWDATLAACRAIERVATIASIAIALAGLLLIASALPA